MHSGRPPWHSTRPLASSPSSYKKKPVRWREEPWYQPRGISVSTRGAAGGRGSVASQAIKASGLRPQARTNVMSCVFHPVYLVTHLAQPPVGDIDLYTAAQTNGPSTKAQARPEKPLGVTRVFSQGPWKPFLLDKHSP